MDVLFDTSILVPAIVAELPQHAKTAPLLRRVIRGESRLHVSTQTLAELYATLTALPLSPRITPGQAARLIEQNALQNAKVISLDADDYEAAIKRMVSLGLSSGAIYDALQVRAAEKAGVQELYTLNGRDFRRMPPAEPTTLVVP